MLKRRAIAPITNHEDLFIQRYRWLMDWALRLTEHDRQQAEDLVQDAFVHFIITRPCLERIQQNIDGYLYTMLKNLHLSEVRRMARLRDAVTPIAEFSLTDYDSVESGLRVLEELTNAQMQTQIREQLSRLCQYACARKSSSKAGSVLLLRFFHGYYPEEIARILRASRQVVEARLRAARMEARVFLEDPSSLTFMDKRPLSSTQRTSTGTPEDFIEELRRQIYGSREGQCLSRKQIETFYNDESQPLTQQTLSHFVSCPDCLDTVNRTLGLPLLADRFPLTMMSKDTRKQNKDGGDDQGGAASGGNGDNLLKKVRRKAQDVLTQRPHELRISINGIILGSQGITSRINRQTISVKGEDRIGFVEIFSEKEVRLLFSCVEPPPDGPIEHKERVVLSDGRSLELLLDFSNATPDLHVTYVDPLLGSEMATESAGIEAETQASTSDSRKPDATLKSTIINARGLFLDWLGVQASRLQFGWKSFLIRPGLVTALVALFLISALLVVYRSRHVTIPAPTAADLLQRSAAAEDVIAAVHDQVIHRSIQLEERKVAHTSLCDGCGELLTRHKIEIWQSAGKGITARRLYDDKGNLVAGDWRRADGLQTLYHHGAKPEIRLQKSEVGNQISDIRPQTSESAFRNLDDVWQLDTSAKDFSSLIGNTATMRVEERGNTNVISVESTSATSVVNKAVLILNKTDLHPIEQTLVIHQGDQTREYKFAEVAFEQKPLSMVAPTIFEPERELLSSATPNTLTPMSSVPASAPLAPNPSSAIATPQLELEAAYLLDQVKANLGEQISLTRTRGGQLRVEGVVESAERKNEIMRALAPLANNPAVVLDVNTVAEASKRQPQPKSSSVTVERVEIQKGMAPLDADLRRYFTARGVAADKLDEEVRQFGNRMIARARQAQMHARVLKSLFERFTGEDLRALDDESRNKRMAMIRQHAEAFRADTAQLRQELETVLFPSKPGERAEAFEIDNDTELQRAVQRLFELGATHENAMYASFSISPEVSATSVVTTAQFWQSLKTAERLATEIQKAASRKQ